MRSIDDHDPLTFARDALGREIGVLERAETTDGFALAFSTDANGCRTRIVLVGIDGSRLELARYAYDARGRMTAAECAFGMSVRYYWHPERDLLLRWHNTTRRQAAMNSVGSRLTPSFS